MQPLKSASIFNQAAHDTRRRLEPAAVFAPGSNETGKEIFLHAAAQIDRAAGLVAFAGRGE